MEYRRSTKALTQKQRCRTKNPNSPANQGNVLGHITFSPGQSIAISMEDIGGGLYVDIRKWQWIDGKPKPTIKGICFPADLLEKIEKHLTKAKRIRDA